MRRVPVALLLVLNDGVPSLSQIIHIDPQYKITRGDAMQDTTY